MTSRYYTMTDSTGESGFLPTVVFDGSSGVFTSAHRINTLDSIGITGFYEADFADAVTDISYGAFQGDTKVVVVTINKVATIRDYAFNGCTAMRSITLDTAVDAGGKYVLISIGTNAFNGCTSLRNLHIPDTVKNIPDSMCAGCNGLELAVMGYGLDRNVNTYNMSGTIGQYAFANCSKLSYFVVPETVSSIDASAFVFDVSLALVYILGRPTISSTAFNGAMGAGATYYYDMSKVDLTVSDISTTFPAAATKNPYREIDLSAGAGTSLSAANVIAGIGTYTSWWKGKILNPIITLANNCFRATTGITAANYQKMIGVSFPSGLDNIGNNAFQNSDGTTLTNCNVGAFYFPPDYRGTSSTSAFSCTSTAGQNLATTKQFVFQSGTGNSTVLVSNMFQYTSAMAIVVPKMYYFGSSCFQFAKYIQYFNFFQKNAYTVTSNFTKIDGFSNDSVSNVFSNCFNALTARTHYLYIPKQIARISPNSFLNITDQLIITAYSSHADGNGAAGAGLCTTAVSNFLEPGRFTGTAPIFQLINNYYDANGLTLGTAAPAVGTYHVLYPSGVKTISNQFFAKVNLKSVAVHHSATQTVTINTEAFKDCTGLNFVYFNNRVKTMGYNVFRNAPLSNSFDLIDAAPLETIYHATFYSDTGKTSIIRQITIPKTVKYLGSHVFGCAATGLKTAFTTLSFETGIAFWGDYNFTVGSATITDTDTASARYMAIPGYFCEHCDFLTNVSFLNTVDASGNAITADANGALTRPNNSLPITTRNNSQILNPLIKRIGQNVFYKNHRLQSIRIPEGVTTIDTNAFYDTHSLTYLYLPDSLTAAIGANAFYGINYTNKFSYTGNEASIRIPQSRIDDTTTSIFNHGNVITYYFTVSFDNTSTSGKVTTGVLGRFTTAAVNAYIKYHVIIQSGISGILGGVTANTRAFDGYTGLKTVNIPDTVTDIGVSAFSGCTGLTNVFISPSSNLTFIDASAFLNCSALTSFFIPNSLDGINDSTFSGCTSLASVTYGNNPGIKYIGKSAFYDATRALTSIFIPSSVVFIGAYAFICSGGTNILNTVTFGAGSRLRYIAGGCFGIYSNGTTAAPTYLRNLVLPNTIRAIGTSSIADTTTCQAFRNTFTRANSANLIFPSSLELMSESILYSDNTTTNPLDISNIYLPLSITNVAGPRKHSGYTSRGFVNYEFAASSSKTGSLIYLPSHLVGYTGVNSTFPDTNRTRSYYKTISYTTNPLISLALQSGTPTDISNQANTSQIHADIKEGVTVIGGGTNNITSATGDGYRNLISVNIPSTVTDICANAFNGCSAMAYVTFSENSHLTTIGNSAFLGCSLIPDIQLPDSLTTIGANAFNGCTNLASISIPYNVTSIGANAFAGTFVRTRYVRLHQKLYNDISGSLPTYFPGVSASSFQVIPALTLTNTLNPSRLTISQINNMYIRYRQSQLGFCTFVTVSASAGGMLTPADVTSALSSSTGLVHLDFGSNVTDISANICNANNRIYSVAISKTVTSVGDAAFSGCTNLSYLSFHPDSVCTNLTYQSFHNTGIFDLALPDSLTAIGASAFQTSRNLTYACIPKNVTAFGTGAFHNCSKLTSVALPSSLASATYANATYFNTNGTTAPTTITSYPTTSAIPHFKLSDYSMPNGIVQNVVDSAVTYIDHIAYAYYPDITLYSVTTTNQTETAGQYNYVMNGIKMPFMPAAFALNGSSVVSNYMFPLYRSVPDLNIFSLDGTVLNWLENTDNYYILMPGYSICIYNNLYDEENLFTDTPTYRYYDNEFGKVPLNITINVAETTSSILILFNGRILTKYFTT